MQLVENYIRYLEKLAAKPVPTRKIKPYIKDIELATNGQLYKTLRKEIPIAQLHASGAFFTGEPMANLVVASIPEARLATVTALDPTCGGGNLLLALARRLPLAATLAATLSQWGRQLHGMDIHLEFVRATRARLVLLATLRGLVEVGPTFFNCLTIKPAHAFPHIRQADSLTCDWPVVEEYLLNPPFNRVPVPNWYRLATGRVSLAALFAYKSLEKAQEGTTIRAVLPDVLRSGTYYTKWRRYITLKAAVTSIEGLGKFDDETNVDVFLLTMNPGEQIMRAPVRWINCQPPPEEIPTIGMICSVRVGRLVPHRDPEVGLLHPYLDVHGVPAWKTITADKVKRRFTGTTFTPPFVVVRRNSRANDPNRAVGTVIKAKNERQPERIAVENHLLVLKPNSGQLADCEALLEILHDPRTNNWLNEHIRCRHLTVSSIQSIPWWPNE